MIPAFPNTYVVEVNPDSSLGFTRTPVVAWEMHDKRPLPVTLNGVCTLIGGGMAVEFPCGLVEHPSYGVAHDSVESWLETNPSEGKRHPASVKAAAPATVVSSGSAYNVEWSKDTFKNNSFWHYDDGSHEFVFQIDGGELLPKAANHVVKIKRDEFMVMKKAVDVLTVDDIKNAEPLEVADEADEAEEDDDDLDDLI